MYCIFTSANEYFLAIRAFLFCFALSVSKYSSSQSYKFFGENNFTNFLSTQKHLTLISTFSSSGDTPCVFMFFVLVKQWLYALIFLEITQLSRIRKFEKCWSKFYQPFWINRGHLSHIFFGGLYHFMINNPFWLPMK